MAEHTWGWVCAISLLGVLATFLGYGTPASLFFMLVGLLIMMKAQGTSLESIIEEDAFAGEPETGGAGGVPAADETRVPDAVAARGSRTTEPA
jgi:hypothetical protein